MAVGVALESPMVQGSDQGGISDGHVIMGDVEERRLHEQHNDVHRRYTGKGLHDLQQFGRPPRVGIQAGHWRVEEVPDELIGLKKSGVGGVWGELTERDVVLAIARRVVTILSEAGLVVDLIPVTVPAGYVADAFVSLHADSHPNPFLSGFKVSPPGAQMHEKGDMLARALIHSYADATGLSTEPTITNAMTNYYAFNWRRFKHSVHPMTPAVIMEVGYLTNAQDRALIVGDVERVAQGITRGILMFLDILPKEQQPPQQ